MGLRSRLDSPAVAAALAAALVLLVGAVAIVSGLVTIPPISFDLMASPSSGPVAVAPTPSAIASPSPVAPTFVRPTPSPEPTFIAYTVGRGETLTSIAKKLRTTARSIAWWNRGTYPSLDPESTAYRPDSIKQGWVLQVMSGEVVDDNNPPTASPAPGA